jgi:hypothetical protein
MAIVLIEEVIMGLDEVKMSLEQALIVLDDMIEDMHPDLGADLKYSLATSLQNPLQARLHLLHSFLEELSV